MQDYRDNPLKIPPTGPGPGGRTRSGERHKIQQNVNKLNKLIRRFNLHCVDLKFEEPLKYAQDPEYTKGKDKLIKRWNPGGAGKEYSGYRDPFGDCGPAGEM